MADTSIITPSDYSTIADLPKDLKIMAESIQQAIDEKEVDLTAYVKKTDTEITNKELLSNKVTTIASTSTNTQYPSAKAVYDYINSLDSEEVSY